MLYLDEVLQYVGIWMVIFQENQIANVKKSKMWRTVELLDICWELIYTAYKMYSLQMRYKSEYPI